MPDIYDMPGHLVRRLNQISVSVFTDHMSRLGLDLTPVQFAALSLLAERPGIDQARLAGAIAYDRTTIGGVIERLEARGWIERRVSQRDRRARELVLSDAGREALDRAFPAVRAVQDEMLAGLSEAERLVLVGLLKKTTEAGNDLSRAPLAGLD